MEAFISRFGSLAAKWWSEKEFGLWFMDTHLDTSWEDQTRNHCFPSNHFEVLSLFCNRGRWELCRVAIELPSKRFSVSIVMVDKVRFRSMSNRSEEGSFVMGISRGSNKIYRRSIRIIWTSYSESGSEEILTSVWRKWLPSSGTSSSTDISERSVIHDNSERMKWTDWLAGRDNKDIW